MQEETIDLETLRETDGYWYLASPYSKYKGGMEEACCEVCRAAAWLIRQGVKSLYVPIAHTHTLSKLGGLLPADHNLWMPFDMPFLHSAAGLIVCMMDGWEESEGVQKEIQEAEDLWLPVFYMNWPRPVELLPSPEVLTDIVSVTSMEEVVAIQELPGEDKEGVLAEAIRITSGPRQRDYDHPARNHERIADLWNAYLGIRKEGRDMPMTPVDVARMMVLLKIARDVFTPKRDNCTDMAGYTRCISQILGWED